MILGIFISIIVTGTFIILWQDEKEKREKAEQQLRQLKSREKKTRKRPELVTIENSKSTKEYLIKKPRTPVSEPLLDKQKLAQIEKQTIDAQGMLAEIFVSENEQDEAIVTVSDNSQMLDILSKLFSREIWTRSEIGELVGPDVMIGSLLEQINYYSCSKINDIVVEEYGDKIYVTLEYKDQLI